jgi:hypothetical protein
MENLKKQKENYSIYLEIIEKDIRIIRDYVFYLQLFELNKKIRGVTSIVRSNNYSQDFVPKNYQFFR